MFFELIASKYCESRGYSLEDVSEFYETVKSVIEREFPPISLDIIIPREESRLNFNLYYSDGDNFKEWKDEIYRKIEEASGKKTECEIYFTLSELERNSSRGVQSPIQYRRSVKLDNSSTPLDLVAIDVRTE